MPRLGESYVGQCRGGGSRRAWVPLPHRPGTAGSARLTTVRACSASWQPEARLDGEEVVAGGQNGAEHVAEARAGADVLAVRPVLLPHQQQRAAGAPFPP